MDILWNIQLGLRKKQIIQIASNQKTSKINNLFFPQPYEERG
jgi:hypothetical protein